MAIKRVATYDKKADRVHELVGLGGLENELGLENQPTHLLVFVGLSTHYTEVLHLLHFFFVRTGSLLKCFMLCNVSYSSRVLLLEVDNRRVA